MPTRPSASRTSSSLNGLMIAMMSFISSPSLAWMWRGGSKGGADREDEPGIDRVGVAEVRIDIGEAERQRPDGRACAERPIEIVAGGGEANVRAAARALARDRRARTAGGAVGDELELVVLAATALRPARSD